MDRTYDKNATVIYVDPRGVRHSALVTVWWGGHANGHKPGCNVVYITGDETKRDTYGAQLERATSVVHKSNQGAPGNFWAWPDELDAVVEASA